jgi:hypothetical protein
MKSAKMSGRRFFGLVIICSLVGAWAGAKLSPASPSTLGLASIRTISVEPPTVGTWFDGLGSPYGGCGVPQDLLETQYFVALNVYNTPGEYSKFPVRPLQGADLVATGPFENGLNCGRWVQVSLGAYCKGTNDGAPNQPFCRGDGAAWIDDDYSGGMLDMLVADSCGDGNAWCRDSRLHLDLSKISLANFKKNGQVLTGLEPAHWNNRGLSWKYIPAPNYSGDIRIHFLKGTQKWWTAIMINQLQNGIHAVEQKVDGIWKKAERYSDLGQGFILFPSDSFCIRIYDVEDKLIQGGREYVFAPPLSCGGTCSEAATLAPYEAFSANGSALQSAPQPKHLRVTTKLQASTILVDFQPPFPGAWTLWAYNSQGRLVQRQSTHTQADGQCHMQLVRPHRGIYALVLQSGAIRISASALALP